MSLKSKIYIFFLKLFNIEPKGDVSKIDFRKIKISGSLRKIKGNVSMLSREYENIER
jgi:hypothetical protein